MIANPPVIAWAVMIGTCLAIGLLNLTIWLWRRDLEGLRFLLSGMVALAAASIGYFEIRLMTTESAGEATVLLRWAHAVLFVLVVGVAMLAHAILGTGRLWLLGVVVAARLGVLVANFASDGNIHHLATISLRTVQFLGGQVVLAGETVRNPWAVLVPIATLVMTAYVVDASVTLWRRGGTVHRRRAVLVGGGISLAIALAAIVSALRQYTDFAWPHVVTPAFLFITLAVAYELVADVLRSAELSRRLQANRSELILAEHRLRLAAEAGRVGIWEWDKTCDEFHLSSQALQILGLPPAATVSTAEFLDRLRPGDREAFRTELERSAAGQHELSLEVRVGTSQGRGCWVSVHGGVISDGSAAEPMLRGVLADVTDRRESDERLNLIAQGSPIGMLIVDRRGSIVFANRKVESLFAYGPGELTGRSIDLLVPHELRGRHATHRGEHLAVGGVRAMRAGQDVQGIRKDGGRVVVEVSLVQVQLHGEPVTLASVIDHGWRREAERELSLQRNELAHLSRAALLGELSGSLAHELNQPLTAILSNAQAVQHLAAQGRLAPAVLDEILVDIIADTRRAGEVIQRLRALLRRGQSTTERVDLRTIVLEVLRLMGSDLIHRRVIVRTVFAPDLPQVLGDRVQLQQVVLNLLLNACEAMADELGSHEVVLGVELDVEGQVRVYVADQGPGIPADSLERVFDAFFTTKPQGLGLGLSLCRTIIEHHRGTIQATNAEAGGAIVDFRLRPAPAEDARA